MFALTRYGKGTSKLPSQSSGFLPGMQCTNHQSWFKDPTGKPATREKLVDVMRKENLRRPRGRLPVENDRTDILCICSIGLDPRIVLFRYVVSYSICDDTSIRSVRYLLCCSMDWFQSQGCAGFRGQVEGSRGKKAAAC
jgi:hypothetical protein